MRRPHQRIEATPWIEPLSLSRFRRDATMGRPWSPRGQHHSDGPVSGCASIGYTFPPRAVQMRGGRNRIPKHEQAMSRGRSAWSKSIILRRKVAILTGVLFRVGATSIMIVMIARDFPGSYFPRVRRCQGRLRVCVRTTRNRFFASCDRPWRRFASRYSAAVSAQALVLLAAGLKEARRCGATALGHPL